MMKNSRLNRLKQIANTEGGAGLIFASPFIFGFFVFLIIPILISFYYSFCNYDILSPPVWNGLKNFKEIFTDDETFWRSLFVTFRYSFAAVPLKLAFALVVALILFNTTKMSGLYRGVYYLPSILGGSVAVSILWRRMFSSNGTINALLGLIGINTQFSWVGEKSTAIWILILLTVWQFGSSMLIFLASLKQIPSTLYEAARVDGANRWHQFWKITFPLLTPTIHFNLIMQTIQGFLAFTQCYIITQGRPMDSTLLYTVYVYRQAFEFYNTGYASALAWIMLFVVALFTWLLFATKRFWVYEGGV
ncbi:carbohydrate ABC transporter permease [Treponema parvum]|uniref:carbohydrate ABC transporter permease n=1 Tax=Treponema parvum TaxID=138851 RepID=UPI002115D615|nr:sugar ABC transporter permease [Treponema parvum]